MKSRRRKPQTADHRERFFVCPVILSDRAFPVARCGCPICVSNGGTTLEYAPMLVTARLSASSSRELMRPFHHSRRARCPNVRDPRASDQSLRPQPGDLDGIVKIGRAPAHPCRRGVCLDLDAPTADQIILPSRLWSFTAGRMNGSTYSPPAATVGLAVAAGFMQRTVVRLHAHVCQPLSHGSR